MNFYQSCIFVSLHVCVNMLGCDLGLMEPAAVDSPSLLRMRGFAESCLIFLNLLCHVVDFELY